MNLINEFREIAISLRKAALASGEELLYKNMKNPNFKIAWKNGEKILDKLEQNGFDDTKIDSLINDMMPELDKISLEYKEKL